MRVLRPLRALSRLKGLQVVVVGLLEAIPSIWHVIIFGLFQTFVFAILGVQLFGGQFHRCNDSSVSHKDECVGRYLHYPTDVGWPIWTERKWSYSVYHFDHMGAAMVSLFIVSTASSWHQISWGGMDVAGVDHQPIENNAPLYGGFFVIFLVLSKWMWTNILVSIVVDFYMRAQKGLGKERFATSEQQKWWSAVKLNKLKSMTIMRNELIASYGIPTSGIRHWLLHIVMHNYCEVVVMVCICLNGLILATQHADQTETWSTIVQWSNFAFTIVFVLETSAKLLALFPRAYFSQGWNCFDFVITIVAMLDGTTSVFRIFRLGRLFKMVQRAKGLRALLNTLLLALPSMANVGMLLLLLTFTFAILGMNLYHEVSEGNLQAINHHLSFQSFGSSMLLLMTVATGSDITGHLHDIARTCDAPVMCYEELPPATMRYMPELPLCAYAPEPDPEPKCELRNTAFFFFPIYFMMANYLLLNLLIAIVLDKFTEMALEEGLLTNSSVIDLVRRKVMLDKFFMTLKLKVTQWRRQQEEIDMQMERVAVQRSEARLTKNKKKRSTSSTDRDHANVHSPERDPIEDQLMT
ncbi:hypothetical protein CYMTET_39150 [Cymbomonas tetramitiformis]|uniref:Ion transport domain-containing protein n=1 Tax=Cymbomonas tetramitiformis TaxID=36881 RepID=A0AAE0CBZ5_9CHLO|nr:hypothetical protein CYMTET_39150 [Cymbomonas tetramitiformis]